METTPLRAQILATIIRKSTLKQRVFDTDEGGTMLALKKLAPTRLIKNEFFNQVKALEDAGAEAAQLTELLG